MLRHRSVEPERQARPVVGALAGMVAHDGDHGIDRDEPADHEGHAREAEKAETGRCHEPDDGAKQSCCRAGRPSLLSKRVLTSVRGSRSSIRWRDRVLRHACPGLSANEQTCNQPCRSCVVRARTLRAPAPALPSLCVLRRPRVAMRVVGAGPRVMGRDGADIGRGWTGTCRSDRRTGKHVDDAT